MPLKTFKYRLYPTPSQEQNLFRVLNCARHLYNMALAERKYAWQLERRSVTNAELETLAKHYRSTFPYAQQIYSQTAQSVVKQVDLAYQAFFRRVKAKQKSGYPRLFAQIERRTGAGVRPNRTRRFARQEYGAQSSPQQKHSGQRMVDVSAVAHAQG